MYKICATQASKQRQRELEAGLMNIMLHHQYENISVSDLCENMGIPRKAFYRYFSSKEGALYALIDHSLLDFAEQFLTGGKTLKKNMAEEFFRYWLTKKDLLRALEYSNLSGLLVQRTLDMIKVHSEYLEIFFPFIKPNSRSYVLIFLVSGLMSLLVQWQRDGFRKSPAEMGEIAVHILTQSFLP